MRIRRVQVKRFRGIKELLWEPGAGIICLVGPGDSMKTTILDAIEYALTPRWNIPLSDVDFYKTETTDPIEIHVTAGDIPAELLKEDKFGLYLRGWPIVSGSDDEPGDDKQPVLTVRLRVGRSCEPEWTVVTLRQREGKPISAYDRERLGVVRLGAEVERELAWGRQSTLSRLAGDSKKAGIVLAEVQRKARDTVKDVKIEDLQNIASRVEGLAKKMGVSPATQYVPGLDLGAFSRATGSLSLHDGDLPLRTLGLGSRRLVALAIQREAIPEGAIVLIDEIENGLEPHRIRRLLRDLRPALPVSKPPQEPGARGDVFLTTHSSVVVAGLEASEVYAVRARDGAVKVVQLGEELQGLLRSSPEAVLARSVVICEGPTEVGLCWGLEGFWTSRNQNTPLATKGVTFVDGGGSSAPKRAKALADLGYRVAYFADSDRTITPDCDVLREAGVEVVRWDGQVSTERRIALDVPLTALQEIVELAVKEHGQQGVLDAVKAKLEIQGQDIGREITAWLSDSVSEGRVRLAIGEAAEGNENTGRPAWFKRRGLGESVGLTVAKVLGAIPGTDLTKKLERLEEWCYG